MVSQQRPFHASNVTISNMSIPEVLLTLGAVVFTLNATGWALVLRTMMTFLTVWVRGPDKRRRAV